MTDDRMALAELLEKGSDGDLLREMVAFMAERLMAADIEARVGAAAGERSQARENWIYEQPSCCKRFRYGGDSKARELQLSIRPVCGHGAALALMGFARPGVAQLHERGRAAPRPVLRAFDRVQSDA